LHFVPHDFDHVIVAVIATSLMLAEHPKKPVRQGIHAQQSADGNNHHSDKSGPFGRPLGSKCHNERFDGLT
jgi:hypothetical protein